MFVPGKRFQSSLIFVGKIGAYLGEVPFRCSTLSYSPCFICKHKAKLEILAKSKNSTLLRTFVNYSHKLFYSMWPRVVDFFWHKFTHSF
jgi:hypothetical protein